MEQLAHERAGIIKAHGPRSTANKHSISEAKETLSLRPAGAAD